MKYFAVATLWFVLVGLVLFLGSLLADNDSVGRIAVIMLCLVFLVAIMTLCVILTIAVFTNA